MATTWSAPSGEGAERCMRMAMATVDTKIDYIIRTRPRHRRAIRRNRLRSAQGGSARRQSAADFRDQGR